MCRIAVCDDSAIQQEILRDRMIEFEEKYNVEIEVETFPNGELLLEEIELGAHFDVFVLDIIMSGPKGNVVAEELRKRGEKGYILFYTATNVFEAKVHEYEPASYVLKTAAYQVFEDNLKKALEIRDN